MDKKKTSQGWEQLGVLFELKGIVFRGQWKCLLRQAGQCRTLKSSTICEYDLTTMNWRESDLIFCIDASLGMRKKLESIQEIQEKWFFKKFGFILYTFTYTYIIYVPILEYIRRQQEYSQ